MLNLLLSFEFEEGSGRFPYRVSSRLMIGT